MFSEVVCPMPLPWAFLAPNRTEHKALDTDTGGGRPPGANSYTLWGQEEIPTHSIKGSGLKGAADEWRGKRMG